MDTMTGKPMRIAAVWIMLFAAGCGDDGSDVPPGDEERSRTEFPRSLLNQPMLFGGAITRVSDPVDEALGSLKLYSFGPLRVLPTLENGPDGQAVMLIDCELECDRDLAEADRYPLPVLDGSPDGDDQALQVELKDLGEMLNIAPIADFDGYIAAETVTDFIDWDNDTMIFDSHSDVTIQPISEGGAERSVVMTVRWYLEPVADLHRDFEPRAPSARVGFFLADDRPDTPIRRISTASRAGNAGAFHYHIKNVPDEYHGAFEAAFEDWNRIFRDELAIEPLTYEFVDQGDPRNDALVAGDVRYNIVEWDIDNQAYYGGLGPSFADPLTGEIIGATVLLQGPAIVELYTAWFDGQRTQATSTSQARDAGVDARAATHAAQARNAALHRRVQNLAARPPKARVSLGRLAARRPPDSPLPAPGAPGAAPGHRGAIAYDFAFDDPPAGQTFESYMQGYFREIVAHELGHNLGLTHNFLGSLADNGSDLSSDSVMEYTWRKVRHKTRVGSYDVAAIRYGYDGVMPDSAIRFCEGSHVPTLDVPTRSAECSYKDGGSDPFAFFAEMRLRRAVDLAIGRDTPGIPSAWSYADVVEPFSDGLYGMTFYATTAEATSTTWTNFFSDAARPTAPAEIRAHVATAIRDILCDPSIVAHIEANHALYRDSGVVAARSWDALISSAQDVVTRADLDADLCVPRSELGFAF